MLQHLVSAVERLGGLICKKNLGNAGNVEMSVNGPGRCDLRENGYLNYQNENEELATHSGQALLLNLLGKNN